MRVQTNPKIGITNAALMARIRSSLRKIDSHTSRSQFVRMMRYKAVSKKGRNVWHVQCELCNLEMSTAEKSFPLKKDGNPYKKKRCLFEVDHIHGNPKLTQLEDLNDFAYSLFFGKRRILCRACHAEHGSKGQGREESL